MAEQARRRRRVRPAEEQPGAAAAEQPVSQPASHPGSQSTSQLGSRPGERAAAVVDPPPWVALAEADPLPAERGLRGLVGSGSSQVSPTAAMRARDAARPRPDDIARAEAELTVVRRRWSPRD